MIGQTAAIETEKRDRPVFDRIKIRILCLEKGKTQAAFAKQYGYDPAYICAIICNRRTKAYRKEIASTFAAYLGVPLSEIAQLPEDFS